MEQEEGDDEMLYEDDDDPMPNAQQTVEVKQGDEDTKEQARAGRKNELRYFRRLLRYTQDSAPQ